MLETCVRAREDRYQGLRQPGKQMPKRKARLDSCITSRPATNLKRQEGLCPDVLDQ